MITTCLTHFSEAYHRFLGHSPALASMVILSVAFPIIAAPFARAAYHRLVTRFMNFRQVRSPPAAWWVRREQHGARSALAANVVEAATPDAFAGTMRNRLQGSGVRRLRLTPPLLSVPACRYLCIRGLLQNSR
jgi:hypothetical protein